MSRVVSGSTDVIDLYMDALDKYGLACAELERLETGPDFDRKMVEDRVQRTRWEYCKARQKYKRRNSQPEVKQWLV